MSMQSLWKQKLERDVPVLNLVKTTWFDWCHDLQKVLEIEIPRCYFQEGNESDTQRRHVFIDKSQLAYGACKYLVTRTESTLAMVRNRVAPLKSITLPKELLEAIIEAKLANYLSENMNKNLWKSISGLIVNWFEMGKLKKTLKSFVS